MNTSAVIEDESRKIRYYGEEGFEGMRKAGRLVAECLDMLVGEVKVGVTTAHLDDLVRQFVFDNGALPATMYYRGYRHASCISLNHVICHGIPGERVLKDGDILNIDVTLVLDGWHGDHSRMYTDGTPKRKAERLMDVTYEAMMAGIAAVKPGNRVADIAKAITAIARHNRYSVVEDFCGHGLGEVFHSEPNIVHAWLEAANPQYEDARYQLSPELKPGMFFTIEPMLNIGKPHGNILSDGWTAVTKDRQLSAQFEHSVGVTEDGVEIFTKSPAGFDTPHT